MARTIQRIAVAGAGAWGTALAVVCVQAGREVMIWAREPEVAEAINGTHENSVFLPEIALPENIKATTSLSETAAADLILLVCPAQHLRGVVRELAPHLAEKTIVLICAKGIEQKTGLLMSQVLAEEAPSVIVGVLSGPSFAGEVARGLPTAVTLAAPVPHGKALAHAIATPLFRPYVSEDIIGAQIGGAVKNVLAIACGVVQGRRLGESARSALLTRGFSELARLGMALGGKAETLNGLSGLGDLVLTGSSVSSRNMSLGVALGEGLTLENVLAERRSVSEGVHTALALRDLAGGLGVEMPIAEAVASLVAGDIDVEAAITGLLSRPLRSEND
ncbi:MAG: NAD(P)H-dependent glycerol-3-phosphate dehydrogenase [Parvularculales bacterium]